MRPHSGKNQNGLQCDRRAFLGLSAAVAAGTLLTGALAPTVSAEPPSAPEVSLKVSGNTTTGFGVSILFQGKPVTSEKSGELSALFQNGERSLEDRVDSWKATSWKGNEAVVTLKGKAHLAQLNATVFVEVIYEVVARNVVRKRIRLRQSDMFMMLFQVTNRICPAAEPRKFWSFDQANCTGGTLREYFPSAGFRTANDVTAGLLTDAGFRNQWSRMFRRDGKPIKPAAAKIPDPNLYKASSIDERRQGNYYVQQTFGEELRESPAFAAPQPIPLPPASEWKRKGSPVIHQSGAAVEFSSNSPDDGLLVPFHAQAGTICSVEIEYRSNAEVSAAIWNVDQKLDPLQNFNQFNDRIPASPESWATFQSTVFVPTLIGTEDAALIFSLPESKPSARQKLEVRSVKLGRMPARTQPYHRLLMDKPIERTSFIFADQDTPDTLRGYRLASEIHLADGLGFQGGETEKVLYADLMMLCWNNGAESFRPMLAPSIWYSAAGEMYLRDSFFALNGVHNQELNQRVFNLWGENQGENGAINTLVEPEMTNLERKSNDSTPLWLMWALLNQRRFGITPPATKVRRAAQYCLSAYDPKGDGACVAEFVMGQLDIVSYPKGISTLCQNQGMLAVTLRTIRELQIPGISNTISNHRLANAEKLYRSYYDADLGFMLPERGMKDAIGFAELFPEYLSLWLYDKKILTDEMMTSHLDRIPVMLPRTSAPHPELGGAVRPIFIGLDPGPKSWRYFTEHWHPMASDSYAESYANHQMDGVYYNGGSWMRIEICGYIAGMLHGWKPAKKAIENRLWAEINIAPDFPTSQEYLPTDPQNPFFGSHRVFAWNAFVLKALEKIGMRSPQMDPDYRGKAKS